MPLLRSELCKSPPPLGEIHSNLLSPTDVLSGTTFFFLTLLAFRWGALRIGGSRSRPGERGSRDGVQPQETHEIDGSSRLGHFEQAPEVSSKEHFFFLEHVCVISVSLLR